MRSSVLLCGVLAVVVCLAYVEAAPQQRRNHSPNPNVNLIRQGLEEKLCKRDRDRGQGGSGRRTSTTTARTTSTTTARSTRGRARTTTAAPAGATCNTYSNYTFEQLIAENRKLLRPVNRRD